MAWVSLTDCWQFFIMCQLVFLKLRPSLHMKLSNDMTGQQVETLVSDLVAATILELGNDGITFLFCSSDSVDSSMEGCSWKFFVETCLLSLADDLK